MSGFRSVAFETCIVFDWVHGLSSQTLGEESGNLILLMFPCWVLRKAHRHLSLFLFASCRTLLSVMFKTDLTLTLLLKTDLTLTILLIQQHAAHTVQAQMLTGASKPIGTQLFKNESMPCVCECPMFLSFSHSWSRKTGYKTLIRVCVYCLLIPSCAFAFRPSLAQT